MFYDDWLDIPCACHSSVLLATILERLVIRIPEGIFLQLSLYAQYTKLVLGKPSIYVGEVVSLPTLTYIKINSTRFAIFIIDICIDNRPFKVFINRKEEGVGDLKCGDVGENNRLGRCCI